MSRPEIVFEPGPPLLPGFAAAACDVCVTIPARNEEALLTRCLDAFLGQVCADGRILSFASFEILLLLNNCTDSSAAVAEAWRRKHPEVQLHVLESCLDPGRAHVGTARRLLMDTAWHRLAHRDGPAAILSTDADTVVAPDWIAQSKAALQRGAGVVGGQIEVLPDEIADLPEQVRACWSRDRTYATLIAQLEDLLDPQPGDRWPRHLDHFGSSLACTTEAYARAGGMPAVTPLEDEAFVDRVRCAGVKLRHEPTVRVFTSARLCGRATIGMAGQLRNWEATEDESKHRVRSAAYLEHRFRTLRRLRQIYASGQLGDFALPTDWWRECFAEALRSETSCAGFLSAVYCDILIAERFQGDMEQGILEAIAGLGSRIQALSEPTCAMSSVSGPTAAPVSVLSASAVQGEGMLSESALLPTSASVPSGLG